MRTGWLLLLLVAAPARAQNPDDEIARAHFQTGLAYYDSDRFAPAVKEFLEAYRISHRPELLFNIARSYEKLDDAGRATFYYRRYLEALPRATERHQIENTLGRMAPHVSRLTVRCGLAGAEVLVDDEVVGLAPIDPQLLTAGRHRVEVRHPGYVTATREIELRGGEASDVRLEPTPGIVVNTVEPTVPKVIETPRPVEPTPPKTIEPTPPKPVKTTIVNPLVAPPVEKKEEKRKWLWPVVGISAGVVVAVAAAIVIAMLIGGGTDFSALARQSCMNGSCVLVQP